MRNNWFTKINFFSLKLIILSVICGICSSVWLGFQIHKQASPNFNKHTAILEFEQKLNSTNDLSSGSNYVIRENISNYNKKIAYAKLLDKFKPQDFSQIQNPELIKLKDSYTASAGKSFAVQEYGIVIIALASIFSMGLSTPSFWLVFCLFIYLWTAGANYSFTDKEAV